MEAVQIYCSFSARIYSAGLFVGFAEDRTHALARKFIRKPAIIQTKMNEWAPLLLYNATFGPNQNAVEEGTL